MHICPVVEIIIGLMSKEPSFMSYYLNDNSNFRLYIKLAKKKEFYINSENNMDRETWTHEPNEAYRYSVVGSGHWFFITLMLVLFLPTLSMAPKIMKLNYINIQRVDKKKNIQRKRFDTKSSKFPSINDLFYINIIRELSECSNVI